ncbi:MAG TPA: serine/threonine-protein kinase, partial [Nannocystaceae bacterium]|nr:serine/threonine-protein kinase [Nannocystaceae bacterium]
MSRPSESTPGASTRVVTELVTGARTQPFVLTPRTGDRIGRYVVVHELGRGGMGTVLRARDPQLGRDIAVKLLRRRAAELPDGAERLLREARSMALLADPNVVQVFEAGIDAGRVFIAMELVDGEDLRAWLRTPRSVAEVIAVFEQAGRGLLAAHRAGLLHRDFKPDNLLVGRDSRVRVGDFGLAQLLAHAHSSEPSEPSQRGDATIDSSDRLTRPGTVIGTPLYMAPEQHTQCAADARADQFAFCVALYEALWRQLPYGGRNADELARGKLAGPREPPSDPHVPPAIRRAVLKGLAVRPDQRHSDMAALLDALARPRHPRARVLGLSAACAGVLALATAGASPTDPRCQGAARRLDGLWDTATRGEIQAAFVDDERPHARETWLRVGPAIDEWTAEWVAVHGQSCTAALAGDDDVVLDARVQCLENARTELAALVDLLRTADDDVVLRSVRAVGALPDPSECLEPAALARRDPTRHAEVSAALARVRALAHAGRYGDAWLEIERISDRPDVASDPALHAEVGLWLGRMRHSTGEFAAAERALVDAYFEAQRAEDPRLAAEAAVALVGVIGEAHPDARDAEPWVRHAEAALAGLTHPDPRTEAALRRGAGNLAMRTGDYARARTQTEAGLRVLVNALGADHIDVGDFHNNLANVAFMEGRYDEAIATHEQALAIRRTHLGDHHPVVGDSYNNLGAAAFNVGRYEESKRYHEQSLAISRAAFGERHADVAASHNNLGGVEQALGDNAAAIAHYRESLAIWSEVLSPDHPDVAYAHNNLGNALLAEKRYDEAAQAYERALAIREHVLGPDHRDVAVTLGNLAVADLAADNLVRAQAELERAIAVYERELGLDHPDLATLLDNLGIVVRRRGDPTRAIAIHERALRIHL